jgi:energy-converting hydrogenase B subunit D
VTVLEIVALSLVAITAPVVVMVDDPLRQSMVLGIYGLFLAASFFVLQAPDVALSMLTVSSVLIPTLVLLALARVRSVVDHGDPQDAEEEEDGS